MINLWQGLELASVVLGMSKSIRKHNQLVINLETMAKMEAINVHFHPIAKALENLTLGITCIYSLLWVYVAYMGNCTGLGLWLYVAFCGATYTWAVHLYSNRQYRYNLKHNAWRTGLTFGIANYLLWLGGFWNGI